MQYETPRPIGFSGRAFFRFSKIFFQVTTQSLPIEATPTVVKVSFSELSAQEMDMLFVMDKYPSEQLFKKKNDVGIFGRNVLYWR